MRKHAAGAVWCVALVLRAVIGACAPKAPPAVAGAPKHPDFMFPAVARRPLPAQASRIDRGWQYLQLDDLPQRRARVCGGAEAAAVVSSRRNGDGLPGGGARQREGCRHAIRSRPAGRCGVRAGADRPRPGAARARSRRRCARQLRSRAGEGSVADRSAQPRRRAAIPRHAGHAGARQGGRRRAALGRGGRHLSAGDRRRRRIRRSCIAISPAVEQKAGQTAERARALSQGRGARCQRCAIAGRHRRDPRKPGRRARRAGRLRAGARDRSGRGAGRRAWRGCAAPRRWRNCRPSIAPSRRTVGDARATSPRSSASGSRRCWRARSRGR